MAVAKNCFKCGVDRPPSEFYKHSRMADGRLNKCKSCTKRDVLNSRAARPEHYRTYDRARAELPHRRALARRVAAAYRKRHPERKAAHVALGNAVRDGRVVKWPVCAMHDCGGRPEAHHPDYSRPLDVVWLCKRHHEDAHSITREAA